MRGESSIVGSWGLGRHFQYPTDKGNSGLADKAGWWETQGLMYMGHRLALDHGLSPEREKTTAPADKGEILFC